MKKLQTLTACALLLCALACSGLAETCPSPPTKAKSLVSAEVRRAARKLAFAWVETAKAGMLDELSRRSIAFAGMVPGLFVVLDGKRMNAGQSLIDSALTIIGTHDDVADAGAIRNSVYILMEISEGRVSRNQKK